MDKPVVRACVTCSIVERRVAIVTIDNPPINAGSRAVREGLLELITTLDADNSVDAAVLAGAGRTFMAGSDIREFGRAIEPPELPQVIAAIGACRIPFVAAIHGAALGGGFELALGCDARVADRDAAIGLPEVTLGMIPGAGGTQHLPRLIPIADAIGIAATGRRVPAQEALRLGLLDAVYDSDLLNNAVEFAAQMGGRKRVLRREQAIPSTPEAVAAAEAAAIKLRKRPNVAEAIALVKHAVDMDFDEASTLERARFQELRQSTEAAALRHMFFAERLGAHAPDIGKRASQPIKATAVIGAGTMGIGIALAIADANLSVMLFDANPTAVATAMERIRKDYATRVARGLLDEATSAERLSRIVAVSSLEVAAQADLVIEAIIEDMDIKSALFARLAALAADTTILASNTSYLDLDRLAMASGRSEQVVGLHFFNPAHRMKLLEVVRPAAVSREVLASALEFAKALGKIAIIAQVGEGFIGNRIYAAYRRQCEFMLEEGALPHETDRALEDFGMAMGPFAVGDLSGLDIAMRMRHRLAATRDPAARYVAIPDRLCEAGRFGRKTGAGYYLYPEGAGKGVPDPSVEALIVAASAEQGIERRTLTSEEIVRRALLAMISEAGLLLDEGVAQRPSDIDVALVHGYGFPAHVGGPLFWATQQDAGMLLRGEEEFVARSGPAFRHGDIGRLLDRLKFEYPLGKA